MINKPLSTLLHVVLGALALAAALAPQAAHADRVKDLASVAAMRSNQLVGYGLVVGLQGTGDGADVSFTTQSMKAMLSRLGVSLEGPLSDFDTAANAGKVDLKNAAAVMVTAELPGFSKPGQKIDINVSAIGKASSLRGGNLVLTSLRGVDGEIYALAQGSLTTTGIDASAAGSKVAIGVPTSGRIPAGATVERIVDNPFATAEQLILNVRESDFTTTTAIINAINSRFGSDVANALDGVSIAIRAPQDLSQRVAFMSMIENLDVLPGDPPARVVINSRTGTVVISRNVRVTAAAVSHGTISVAITATND
ncbi:MAG: Flagellar P-ring protein precursor, partial [Pseudomonadota bacterium]